MLISKGLALMTNKTVFNYDIKELNLKKTMIIYGTDSSGNSIKCTGKYKTWLPHLEKEDKMSMQIKFTNKEH